MILVGAGGVLFALGLGISVYGVMRSFLPSSTHRTIVATPAPETPTLRAALFPAWTGPLSVLILVTAMYAATIGAFELMQALPVAASGAAGH